MVRFLGIVFIGILISAGVIAVDVATKSNYVIKFLTDNSLQIVGTIIALNVATVTFLLSNLAIIERTLKKESFKNTRKEIKQNVYFMIVVFPVLLLCVTPLNNRRIVTNNHIDWRIALLAEAGLILVFFVIYILLEIVGAVFKINKFAGNDNAVP